MWRLHNSYGEGFATSGNHLRGRSPVSKRDHGPYQENQIRHAYMSEIGRAHTISQPDRSSTKAQ